MHGKTEKPLPANRSHSSPDKCQAQHTEADRDDGQRRIHLVPLRAIVAQALTAVT
jgi:hypothetical protein